MTIELRDESQLRLFFADALAKEHALTLLEARQRGHEMYLDTLRAIDARPGRGTEFVDLILRWGISYNEWLRNGAGSSWSA